MQMHAVQWSRAIYPAAVSCLATALCLTGFTSSAYAQPPVRAFEPPRDPTPTITVEGNAEVRVKPDEVLLSFGLESRATTVKDAKKDNDQRLKEATEYLRSNDIDEKDIRTDVISIQPEFDHNQPRIEPRGYVVRRQLGVRLTKLDQFEELFEGLIARGVNQVEGIEFRTTKLREHRDTARKMAIKAAREKAVALAEELEAKVSGVQSINENTWGGVYSMSNNRAMMQNAMVAGDSGEGASGGLAAGQLTISARVNVVFTMSDTSFGNTPKASPQR